MIGYAMCGSFCTLSRSLKVMESLINLGYEIQPILSENAVSTDTRFMRSGELLKRVEELCQRRAVLTVKDAEPFGQITPLTELIIAPCTGNTLAKIAHGVTDSTVTMAAKAHLRCDRPMLVALASNDALSQNLKNVATLLSRRAVYFVPLLQDDPEGKPHSLVAQFELLPEAFAAMKEGRQLRPLFLTK